VRCANGWSQPCFTVRFRKVSVAIVEHFLASPALYIKEARSTAYARRVQPEEDDVNNAPESPVASGSRAASPVLTLTPLEQEAAEAFISQDRC
jgi:hypothetical protein